MGDGGRRGRAGAGRVPARAGQPAGRPAGPTFALEDLEEAWTLGPDEHALLSGKRGATRLGFAVVLRFFAREGRFPAPEEVGEEAVGWVASQTDVPAADYRAYDHRGRTAEYHRAQIREAFGFRPATAGDADALADWLLEEGAPREYDLERLKEAAYARLRALRVGPPAPGRVERAARSALRRFDERFREQTLSRLSPENLAELDALLSVLSRPRRPEGGTGRGGRDRIAASGGGEPLPAARRPG